MRMGKIELEDRLAPSSGAAPVSYKGRRPASARASAAARGSSKKVDTKCELLLRRSLWAAGYRFLKNVSRLPGHPDIVFPKWKVAVFCDGDFWHGRDWESRRQKLGSGTNSDYWLAKIQRNMERDSQNTFHLQEMGWTVLRFWESEIRGDPSAVAQRVATTLHDLGHRRPESSKALDKTHPMT